MSPAEIREQIAGLTVEERLDRAALIAHPDRTDAAEYQSAPDQRAAGMEAGRRTTLDGLGRQPRGLLLLELAA